MKKGCLLVITILFACLADAQDRTATPIPQILHRLSLAGRDTSRIRLLLDLADAYIHLPGEEKHDLDTALLLIAQARKANTNLRDSHIEGRCDLLYAKANREKGENALAKTSAIRALSLLEKERTPDLADAEVEAARYFSYTDSTQNQKRIALYRDAIPIYQKAGRQISQARTLELLGDCLQYDKLNVVDALPPLLQAYHIYTGLGEKDFRNCCNLLATVYSRLGDQRSALVYSLMAVRQEEAQPSAARSLCISYNRLGFAYFYLGEFSNADKSFSLAARTARRIHDTDAIKESVINGVHTKLRLHQTDSALFMTRDLAQNFPPADTTEFILLQILYLRTYITSNRPDLARPYARELAHLDSLTPVTRYTHDYIISALIDFGLEIKDYSMARRYATMRRNLCRRYNYSPALSKCYYQLFRTDSAEGRYRSAMTNFQQYIQLRDSLQNQTDNNQFLALRVALEAGNNEKLPPLSATDSGTLTGSHPKSSGLYNSWRDLLLTAAFILLVGLGISYGRIRTARRNRELQAEKEWLVKELHHRVKNNLQIVMSLLNTQSLYLDNEKAQAAIGQSRNRMYALSLIHQRLFQSDDLERVDMKRYIPDLAQHLRDSFPEQRRIVFHFDIDTPPLDVTTAVPLGLILNETISNSLQWAFPANRPGTVHIILRQQGQLFLEITDDGIGLHDQPPSQHTMGMHLVETLVQQLEGSIDIAGNNGTHISIRLPLPK